MTSTPGTTLDALLETLAEDTWENLREAKTLSIRFGEETITDTLMLELRRKGFKVFKQTSLHDEAKFGTDFECWVGSNGTGWVGYAIQAKKLDFRTGTYQNLGYVVKGPGRRQIDILKAYAKKRGMVARYCLYSHSPKVSNALLTCCSRSFPEEELGCTITPPSTIERAIATHGGKGFHCLQRHSVTVPWRCLAVCPRLRGALASRSVSEDDLSPLLDSESTIHRRLPDNLRGFLAEVPVKFPLQLSDDLASPMAQGQSEVDGDVDFEQWGIGVDSREMDYGDNFSPRLIIPKRVYILELPTGP